LELLELVNISDQLTCTATIKIIKEVFDFRLDH